MTDKPSPSIDKPGPQPHPSDEPPIPDRDDLPGTPRPADQPE